MANIGQRQSETGYYFYHLASNGRLPKMSAGLALGQLKTLDEENRQCERNEELGQSRGSPRNHATTGSRPWLLCGELPVRRTAFDGLSRDWFLEAIRAEGVPVSDGYEMLLYRQPACFRNDASRLLPPGTELSDYPNHRLSEVEEVCETNVTYSHRLLLAEKPGIRLVAAAIRKIQENVGAIE